MKIVIAGAGSVGRHLAKMLSVEHHDICVIDEDEERLRKLAAESDIVAITGKPTSLTVLNNAGVAESDLFIAVSPAEEQDVNIVSAILAKKLGAKKVTARVNNEEYQKVEIKLLFTELGIDSLFYPERIAAEEILNLLKQNATNDFMTYSHGRLQLIAFRVEEDGPLIDKTVGEIRAANKSVFRPVALTRNSETIIPVSSTKFRKNDQVYIIATKEGAEKAMAYSGRELGTSKRLFILGGGRIGAILASKLDKNIERLKIVEINAERCEQLSGMFTRTLVINGDGRNYDMLADEGLRDYDAFVAVTGSSETNILSCVMAKRMGVPKVIAEVENFEYINLAEGMGVDSVINKKLVTASKIFRFTLSNKVRSLKVLSGTSAEVMECIVNPTSLITTAKLRDLEFPEQAIIGGVIRGNEAFIADGDTEFRAYDHVVVFANPAVSQAVNKFFE